MIVSFLEGKAKNLSPDNCKTIGIEVARMHELTKISNLKERMISLLTHGGVFLTQLEIIVPRFIKICQN